MKIFFLRSSIVIVVILLIYSRFIGLDWGFPYPMHPDENNMVRAIGQMRCPDITDITCLYPDFFAYGQFPLFIGYGMMSIYRLIAGLDRMAIGFEPIALSLRILSATASLVTAWYLFAIIRLLYKKIYSFILIAAALMIIFVPAFIQFSHFGTTESLLMMFFTMLLYFSLRFIGLGMRVRMFTLVSGVLLGLAMGTKVSAVVFAAIPAAAFAFRLFDREDRLPFLTFLFGAVWTGAIGIVFFIISSPHNLIAWTNFIGAMDYESSVGLGTYRAFYTRQFEYTVPFVFQLLKVFPYTLGGPLFMLFLFGFFFLPNNREYNFMRLQFLLFVIPVSIVYAKWSRFLSPVFPLMVIMGILFFIHVLNREYDRFTGSVAAALGMLIVVIAILPGVAYLSIYQNPDVRFVASQWIYKEIPSGSVILSETANVVDMPIPSDITAPSEFQGKSFQYISFNSYDLDTDPQLQRQFEEYTYSADYIFIPSRRVFYNHTCTRERKGDKLKLTHVLGYEAEVCKKWNTQYPQLNEYYENLFSGTLPYVKVAEFHSYPRIEVFGLTIFELPDESAEETWTVFDHPVVRIYKRSS